MRFSAAFVKTLAGRGSGASGWSVTPDRRLVTTGRLRKTARAA